MAAVQHVEVYSTLYVPYVQAAWHVLSCGVRACSSAQHATHSSPQDEQQGFSQIGLKPAQAATPLLYFCCSFCVGGCAYNYLFFCLQASSFRMSAERVFTPLVTLDIIIQRYPDVAQ
jgi:hypothetical protein